MKCMKSVAHSLIGAAQIARNCGRRLPLGTGKEDLAAAHGKGGRRPETGLQGCTLVRRERAYKEGRLHTQEYTTCPKTSIGGALGTYTLSHAMSEEPGACHKRDPHIYRDDGLSVHARSRLVPQQV